MAGRAQEAMRRISLEGETMTNLETELLAALIQMEYWAGGFAKHLDARDANMISIHRDIGRARVVITKAKEQSNA